MKMNCCESGIKGMDPRAYEDAVLTQEEILGIFALCNAAWIHDGDPKKPHAVFTSGKHSNAYFNCSLVLKTS